jgi:hypothetical protein
MKTNRNVENLDVLIKALEEDRRDIVEFINSCMLPEECEYERDVLIWTDNLISFYKVRRIKLSS